MVDFALDIEQLNDGVVIRLVGELTVEHTPQLEQQLRTAAQSTSPLVVIDASQLTFICSAGLGALVEFRHRLSESSRSLRLAGAPPRIADVFQRTRLAELFPMYASPEQALTQG